MSDYKSHQIQLSNIPEGKSYCKNTTKSFRTLIFVALMTLFVFGKVENKLFSVPLFMYLIILIFRPEELVLAMYENFIVYYDEEKESYEIIYYSEIEQWKYEKKFSASKVILYLASGEEITINNGLNVLTYHAFKKYLKTKEKI